MIDDDKILKPVKEIKHCAYTPTVRHYTKLIWHEFLNRDLPTIGPPPEIEKAIALGKTSKIKEASKEVETIEA